MKRKNIRKKNKSKQIYVRIISKKSKFPISIKKTKYLNGNSDRFCVYVTLFRVELRFITISHIKQIKKPLICYLQMVLIIALY